MENNKILDISARTILKISLAIICFYFLYVLRDIVIWLIFALIISVLFEPAIDFLQRKRVPRALGTVFVYSSIFGILILLIWIIVPIFGEEMKTFIESFPVYFEKISPTLRTLGFQVFENIQTFTDALQKAINSMSESVLNVLFAIFGGIFSTLFVIATAMFLSIDEKSIEMALVLLFPKKYEHFILDAWGKTQKKVSGWFLARVISCLFVGVASYIIFLIFDVEYPLILAVFSGAFNFVPYIGPLITGILLFLIVFPTELVKSIFVIAGYMLIQQIENHILSPILMKKMVNIPPALVIVSLVVGAKLWGFLGSLLVIPLAGIIFEFTGEFLKRRKLKENAE